MKTISLDVHSEASQFVLMSETGEVLMEMKVEGKEAAAVLRLIEALEEQDDVQSVYSNYDIADEVIDAITAA